MEEGLSGMTPVRFEFPNIEKNGMQQSKMRRKKKDTVIHYNL